MFIFYCTGRKILTVELIKYLIEEKHLSANTLPRCKYADVKCLENIINKVIKTSSGGSKNFLKINTGL